MDAHMGRDSSLVRTKHRYSDVLQWADDISNIFTVDAPAGRELGMRASGMLYSTQKQTYRRVLGRSYGPCIHTISVW